MGFKAAEIAAATGGRILAGGGGLSCSRVVIDSRRVAAGDLFVAIPGERFDGHDFVTAAAAAGAAMVMVARDMPPDLPGSPGVIRVPDTVAALGDLARFHRLRYSLPVVAVTGSTGKTTTKEMIAAVGGVRHRVAKNEGNLNNEIGLPLTLFDLTDRDELLVVEMGMRGPGQIAALAGIARPDIGVITNIGLTHLELLGSREAIAAAKGELAAALPADGTAVLNADDPYFDYLASLTKSRVVSFGFTDGAAVRAFAPVSGPAGESFLLRLPDCETRINLNVPGRHQVENALAAAAVAHALGYEAEEIRIGLGGFGAARGRGGRITAPEGWTVIDDTYNASPTSMAAALSVLRTAETSGRRIAVLADMLELGPAAVSAHREVGAAAAAAGVTLLLATGDLAREIVQGALTAGFPATMARHFPDKRTLIESLRGYLRAGDLVLVKGSRGMKMEEIVEGITGGHSPDNH